MFRSKEAPSFGIDRYLRHLTRSLLPNAAVPVLILIYIERLIEGVKENGKSNGLEEGVLRFDSYNCYRVLVAAWMLAIKYSEERRVDFKVMSKIGGISSDEAEELEMEFLKLIDYRVFVSEEVFQDYRLALFTFL